LKKVTLKAVTET